MAPRRLPAWFPRTDYYINVILLSLGTLGAFVILGFFLFIPLGIWQVIVGLVRVYGYRQARYQPYLLLTALWFAVAGIGAALGLLQTTPAIFLLGSTAWCLAVYACYLSRCSYVAARRGEEIAPPELMDHLL